LAAALRSGLVWRPGRETIQEGSASDHSGHLWSCRDSRIEGAAEIGEKLRKTAGRRARLRRGDECHFGIGDRWKAILRAQHIVIGENGDLWQDADAEAGRDSGLNAENIGARVGDMPGTTDRLKRIYRPVAVKAPPLGWLLISERIALADLIGIVPVALGIYLVTRPAAPARGPAALARRCKRLNLRGSDGISIADQNDLTQTRVVTRITSPR
jgi:hypothetical protein